MELCTNGIELSKGDMGLITGDSCEACEANEDTKLDCGDML